MPLPSTLNSLADKHYAELESLYSDCTSHWTPEFIEQLKAVLALSPFCMQVLQRDAEFVQVLPDWLSRDVDSIDYRASLAEQLATCNDEPQGLRVLRKTRNREMFYIAWRDFLGLWDVEPSLTQLSELAESLIVEAYNWQYTLCCNLWGTPVDEKGVPQPMLVIGMGKLGGGELNFSSDIDLIFTYPENGETQGARRSIANAQFFTRLGQRVIKALDQQTFDGFCYRVDMRLRPFGESGPLVMSFSALEDYYQEQGRDWERYAMVKARVMGKEMYPQYQSLRKMLRPFVFRRYIDFSAIQSLRRMKGMIRSEVRRRGLTDNIKLGAGGIREIEFIAQVFQLIRGGREPQLRERGLLITLKAIDDLQLLDDGQATQLADSYRFLRRLENLLQALDDKQTQTLPQDDLNRLRLSYAMGYEDWSQLSAAVSDNMLQVHSVFEQLIGDEEEDSDVAVPRHFAEMWDNAADRELVISVIESDLGHPAAESLTRTIIEFKQELSKRTLGPRGREVLNHLMPKLFEKAFSNADVEFGLPRVLHVLNRISTRTTYLELLDEHPGALSQLVRLCTASPMISELLGKYPILLDELLDPAHLYNPVELSSYKRELRDFLARIPQDDMEQQMEGLRQFKQVCILRIAAADIAGALPVMKVSDHLTSLAEAIVDAVVHQAWLQLSEKYGEPSHLAQRDGKGFAVIGYGKVGGWELGYNSDLDIVFLHDSPLDSYTDGKKEIDARQFYLRLAQRIIHIFSVRTASGILYEVDTRLRPSGASGLLVSPTEAFLEYQLQEAWTWEHQALVRTRMIYGDEPLQNAFTDIRKQVLCQVRDSNKLRKDVVDMRVKMRDHLGGKKAGRFMLKQDPGGITDVEFIAQFLVLDLAHKHPELVTWSDNVRIFETLAQLDIFTQTQQQALNLAYTELRDEIHHRNLLNQDADVDEARFTEHREVIKTAWKQWLETEN
ncbi:bifunctional [glutamate--ammonia ligase]-adenylyl-L-tyrosine phosphorylase/[glutamate--ammonia-ligase] adenylyltransferase [Vibrio ulleungensis]|uniref:Bifunctional glutamine synthetase adenylyltransferase/adenylyl-removing enzyme n=1 Tax=Vibrio ulleungensis TaxID=2807619 RepID=A0ABS2HMK6_9VIBR|nr:bifunctional [glutamate--ammonia ligase]-adenylyl-L-tyrosine phosphorylase/[glutamate--ammonia-ligase] adenylyltransferase [Vibrio ulleungensis]MBM7037448.1 bifunctional [glutamate--ammonia ligase]-adenylyl-L-tyrosine phosphorylase/[glutamate--ammonia-ligase] adenylyltransferase [Vibrio ulleungensis]